ncbi:hypothetical protein G3A39_40795 [Paraburkholderia aspalathi]|nr:hypothetical protein [Paraburkholderia aspalathi]
MLSSGLGAPTEVEIVERLERTAEIQAFSQKLLVEKACFSAFKRVGIGGDFTEGEYETIYIKNGLGEYFTQINVLQARHYQAVIQALARRVAAGVFESVFATAAIKYALERTFAGSGKFYNRIRDQTVSFEEFRTILKEYMAWEDQTGIREKIKEKVRNYVHPEDSEDDWDEATNEFYKPLEKKNAEIFQKYGLINRVSVTQVAFELRREGKNADDAEAVKELVAKLEYDHVDLRGDGV